MGPRSATAPAQATELRPGESFESLLPGITRELQHDQLGTYERLAARYGDLVRLVVGPPGLRRSRGRPAPAFRT
jgi:hypothetical protein